ncbi:MAG: iron-sulfur cluster assembly accessory protein [Pseudomonadota bacterium]
MTATFTISESATARIAHLLASEPAGTRLRVAVEGGGCSGFQYKFDFDPAAPGGDDLVFGASAAPVVVDSTSLQFIGGSMLDYVETLGAAAFEIKNPQAKSSCGCGNSFSIAL